MSQEHWATDSLISFPEPPRGDTPVLVGMDGFGFTAFGIVHDISLADVEEMTSPMFAPEGFRGGAAAHDQRSLEGRQGGPATVEEIL